MDTAMVVKKRYLYRYMYGFYVYIYIYNTLYIYIYTIPINIPPKKKVSILPKYVYAPKEKIPYETFQLLMV